MCVMKLVPFFPTAAGVGTRHERMTLTILINGSSGRMGHALVGAAKEANLVVGATVRRGENLNEAMMRCDVALDFSSPEATGTVIEAAVAHKKAIVLGTTGHSAADKKRLFSLAANVPCVWAGNFSVGVNLLFAL